jgi:predicted RNase H-like nuclease (RuvC/YqgF family)
MSERLTPEEVAICVKARRIVKEKGLPKDADVTRICEEAGISRKTGYQWAEKLGRLPEEQKRLKQELEALEEEKERLLQENDDLRFEYDGMKVAWRIHHIDELLAEKKRAMGKKKGKRR